MALLGCTLPPASGRQLTRRWITASWRPDERPRVCSNCPRSTAPQRRRFVLRRAAQRIGNRRMRALPSPRTTRLPSRSASSTISRLLTIKSASCSTRRPCRGSSAGRRVRASMPTSSRLKQVMSATTHKPPPAYWRITTSVSVRSRVTARARCMVSGSSEPNVSSRSTTSAPCSKARPRNTRLRSP